VKPASSRIVKTPVPEASGAELYQQALLKIKEPPAERGLFIHKILSDIEKMAGKTMPELFPLLMITVLPWISS